MKTICLITLLFPLLGLASIEFRTVRTLDGETIQTCIRYPDPVKFPGRRPAIMFIQGSGMDDACLRLSRPYGTGIVERGVAIFGRQKRGITADLQTQTFEVDPQKFATNTLPSLESDAIAAFEDLQSISRIDPKRISVAGGSEGTILATAIAEKHPEIHELSLISSMIENFDRLYERQISVLVPQEIMSAMDGDKSGCLSPLELNDVTLYENGLLNFKSVDSNQDGQVDKAELAAELHRALAYSLATDDDKFPMSDFGGRTSVKWLRSAYQAKPLGPRVLNLSVSTTLHHGRADINTSVEPIYDLQKQASESNKLNLHFVYYDGLTHEMSKDVIYKILFDLADNLVRP